MPKDKDLIISYISIDFAAHSEFFQINAGLNRKSRVGNDFPFVFGLQIINIGTICMHFGADGMTGAVYEFVSISALDNIVAADVIDLVAVDY